MFLRHQLAFNLIPHIDTFQENGYTREEMKVTWETRKIFHLPTLPVSCTAVRIPILRAHSEAITVQTELPVDLDELRELLRRSPGVRVVDDPAKLAYPMPLTATRSYDVEVGRIRHSILHGSRGLDLFVSGDQLLRGAALNAVLIAELALKQREAGVSPARTMAAFRPSFMSWLSTTSARNAWQHLASAAVLLGAGVVLGQALARRQ